jgi:hypothetical protein
MADHVTVVMNLENFAVTQYGGEFDFKSMCDHNGEVIGSNSSGIFKLNQMNAPEIVEAYFDFIPSDFGFASLKRMRWAMVGGEADGLLRIKLYNDDKDMGIFNISIGDIGHFQGTADCQWADTGDCIFHQTFQGSSKAYIGNEKGRYWKIRIENTGGADFSVDAVDVLLSVLGYRPTG